jgi:fructosamine-3-kinase
LSRPSLLHRVVRSTPVGGGCITDTRRAELDDGRIVFLKVDASAPRGFFEAEAAGLRWLRSANALPVPEVLEVAEGHLALEWVERGHASGDTAELLGRGLSALHSADASRFGRPSDDAPSYLATLQLPDTSSSTWGEFWIEGRVRPLALRATAAGLLPDDARHAVDRVAAAIDDIAGPRQPPARVHGDLWSGNVHIDRDGTPWLVDPSAHGGHRETDLAMLELFGGVDVARVRAAYQAVTPLADGWQSRIALHQLVPLLAHVVLFGTSYVAPTRRAFEAYVPSPW